MKTLLFHHFPRRQKLSPSLISQFTRQNKPKTARRSRPLLQKRYSFQTIQKAIRDEKFKFNRKANGEGDNKFTEFQSEISEVQQLREKLGELKVERNDLREKLHKLIEEAKANVKEI